MTLPLRCPTCGGHLAAHDGIEFGQHQHGFLIHSADAIPGTPERVGRNVAMASALIGACKACGADYWLLEYLVYRGGLDVLTSVAPSCMEGWPSRTCRPDLMLEADWVYWEHTRVNAYMERHQVGPFPVATAACLPSSGTSAAFSEIAAGIAHEAWKRIERLQVSSPHICANVVP